VKFAGAKKGNIEINSSNGALPAKSLPGRME